MPLWHRGGQGRFCRQIVATKLSRSSPNSWPIPDALDAYIATLEDERRRRGRDVELRLLGMAGLDIPDDQIATEGFGGLSDDHLADIALSPEAIHAIREYLDEAECGAWLIDKIIEVESARPEAAECARRAQEIFQGLRNIRTPGHREARYDRDGRREGAATAFSQIAASPGA